MLPFPFSQITLLIIHMTIQLTIRVVLVGPHVRHVVELVLVVVGTVHRLKEQRNVILTWSVF